RIILDAAGQGNRLAGMTRINLKAMYNDPSQVREALAWRLFGLADIPAPRHTYAKLAFGTRYRGLFSVIEHVDEKFLSDRLGGGEGRFATDAFRESVDGIMNVNAFLRWAAVNMLLGSWDNYYASGSNYYLYNSGHRGAAKDFVSSPYFHFIPWDYDNCLGID